MHAYELAILAGRAFETGFCTTMVRDYIPSASIRKELAEAESASDVPRVQNTQACPSKAKDNPSLLRIVRCIGEIYGGMEKARIGIDGVSNPIAVTGYESGTDGSGNRAPTGNWRNADLLFVHEDALYVYELTVSGGLPALSLLGFSSEKRALDFHFQAAASQLNIGVASETLDFPSVCLKLIESTQKILRMSKEIPVALEVLLPETAKLFQVMAYATSFLKDHFFLYREKIRRVVVTVLHPVFEVQRIVAPMDRPPLKTLLDIAAKFQTLYTRTKEGRNVKYNAELRPESLKAMLKCSMEELGRVADDPMVITPSFSINDLRRRTKDFLERAVSTPNRLFFMGSCPGSGKTTAIKEGMLPKLSARAKESGRKVTILYFSPRRALNESLTAGMAPQNFRSSPGDKRPRPFDFLDFKVLPVDTNGDVESEYRYGADSTAASTPKKGGNIQNAVRTLQNVFPRQNHLVIITTQSITQSPATGQNTANYFIKHMRRYPKREFWVIFDEILGSEGAVHAILKIIHKAPDNCRVVALDATAPNGLAFKTIIEQAARSEAVPPHLVRLKNSSRGPWTEEVLELSTGRSDSVKALCAWGYSFPAKRLTVKIMFVRDDDNNRSARVRIVVDHAVRLIGDNPQDPSQVFVYVQDKSLVKDVRQGIEERIPTLSGRVVSFTSRTNVADANKQCRKAKVVVSTSTTSRGVDTTPRGTRCLVVFPSFNEEEELAELPQVIGRMRGDAEFEKCCKEVNILFFSRSKKALNEQRVMREQLYLDMIERDRLLTPTPDAKDREKFLGIDAHTKKKAQEVAALTTAILETLHKAGLARLARETIQSVVAPGDEILLPVRLLHPSVVNPSLITKVTNVARMIVDSHQTTGFDNSYQAEVLANKAIRYLGIHTAVPRDAVIKAVNGQVMNTGCVHYPFLLLQLPFGNIAWLGGTGSEVMKQFEDSIQEIDASDDIRPSGDVKEVLQYLRKANGFGIDSGPVCVAVYLPWFILCQEYPEMAGHLVEFRNIPEITRYRLRLLTAGCGDISFSGREIVGFPLDNPMAHRILRNVESVVKLPIDLV